MGQRHIHNAFVLDTLPSAGVAPMYDVGKTNVYYIADKNIISNQSIDEFGRFTIPTPYEMGDWKTHHYKNPPKEIHDILCDLIYEVYNAHKNEAIKMNSLVDAHKWAVATLAANQVEFGLIFGNIDFTKDEREEIHKDSKNIISYDFDRCYIPIKKLPKNVLAFSGGADYFGVLPITYDKKIGAAVFDSGKNFIVMECQR